MTKPRRTPRLKPSRNLTRNRFSIANLRVLEGELRARVALPLEEIAQIKEEIARQEIAQIKEEIAQIKEEIARLEGGRA